MNLKLMMIGIALIVLIAVTFIIYSQSTPQNTTTTLTAESVFKTQLSGTCIEHGPGGAVAWAGNC